MRQIVDFHIHSKYSRATSKFFDLPQMAKWAAIKGVDIISSADFTHPTWFKNLEENLAEDQPGSGLYKLKNYSGPSRFLISTEVSCIYSQADQTRRIHLCILAPNLAMAKKFSQALSDRGAKLASDGRPILGMSARQILEIALETDDKIMVIPAHAWTPWFAVFGSKSGFNSLQECFGDLTPYIKAIETGLSSDPAMNWRWSKLDEICLVSNSDAHSGPQIGREANAMELGSQTYDEIVDIISKKDKKRFLYTIEFFPEEGMYHWDGHRDCSFSCSPIDTKKYKGLCPKCKKPLTIGVLNQVDKLSDLPESKIDTSRHIPYKNIIPLPLIIADYYGVGRETKRVQELYKEVVQLAGNEFKILLDLPYEDLVAIMPVGLADGIIRTRNNQIKLIPGFDGQYGRVEIFSDKEQQAAKDNQQTKLF